MARHVAGRDLSPILKASQAWIDTCLVNDSSLLSQEALWTPTLVEEVKRAFVDHPDAGEGDFLTKLKGQLNDASPEAKRLMAEMLWALLLFPSNINPETKREQIAAIWALSGKQIPVDSPHLTDQVLEGIGSGGPGFNNHRWRELVFLIALAGDLKRRASIDRLKIFSVYDAFSDWIESVPRQGHRQFRHMLRYFAFPDRVERMSSGRERRRVLLGFEVASKKEISGWNDRQLDDALLTLRRKLEEEHSGQVLDFYHAPLKSRWQVAEPGPDGDDEVDSDSASTLVAASPLPVVGTARNLILYGPPGTGKTYWLRRQFEAYTDAPELVDQDTWLQETVGRYGWRSVIAAVLAQRGSPARVPEIGAHRWIRAKTKQRGRSSTGVQATLWGYLQEHTPETISTVKVSVRRPPFIFSKSQDGDWTLLADWRDLDEESADLERVLKAGPAAAVEPIRRYRVVTFHPSFSYEDFVRGIRPVATANDGSTQFRLVDGIFKQICDAARANPSKRYALFIDEINRANIAKVFGELITLMEVDKRAVYNDSGRLTQGMTVQLPGGNAADEAEPPFGVPSNLDIYGTMNTADRSIALLDVALRRRFEFQEMEPEYSLIDKIIDGVHLGELLRRLNDRMEYLLDRDHRIGHAYLMTVSSLDDLRRVFRTQIIPLLQEYFFDDFSRVAMVLTTNADAPPFFERERLDFNQILASAPPERVALERSRFTATQDTTWTAASFRGIYAARGSVEPT